MCVPLNIAPEYKNKHPTKNIKIGKHRAEISRQL